MIEDMDIFQGTFPIFKTTGNGAHLSKAEFFIKSDCSCIAGNNGIKLQARKSAGSKLAILSSTSARPTPLPRAAAPTA
jgi:hypothetical protein